MIATTRLAMRIKIITIRITTTTKITIEDRTIMSKQWKPPGVPPGGLSVH